MTTLAPAATLGLVDQVLALRATYVHEAGRRGGQGLDLGIFAQSVLGVQDLIAYTARGQDQNSKPYRVTAAGVALIPVAGFIARTTSQVSFGGRLFGTSHELILQALRESEQDAAVTARMLVIDSPGGYASGIGEFADALREASAAKPVWSYVVGGAYSAAYYAASQTQRVLMGRDGEVGSIGVFTIVYDESRWYEDQGVKATLISSGGVKGQGSSGVPISAEAIAHWQDGVNKIAQQFTADALVRGRGLPMERAAALSDGRSWIGAEAKTLGLVDDIQSFAAAVAALERDAGVQAGGVSQGTPRAAVVAVTAEGSGVVGAAGPQEAAMTDGTDAARNSTGAQEQGREAAQRGEQNGNQSATLNAGTAFDARTFAARNRTIRMAAAQFAHLPAVQKVVNAAIEGDDAALTADEVCAKIEQASRTGLSPVLGRLGADDVRVGNDNQETLAQDRGTAMVLQSLPTARAALSGNDSADPHKADRVARALGFADAAQARTRLHSLAGIPGGAGLRNVISEYGANVLRRAGRAAQGRFEELYEAAMGPARFYAAGGQHSSSDFPFFLSNIANKIAMVSFAERTWNWRDWCGIVSVSDFKTVDLLRLSFGGNWAEVREGDRPDQTSFSERRQQLQVRNYGSTIAFTMQMAVNDDLSAFARAIADHSTGAGRLVQDLAMDALQSNPAVFGGDTFYNASRNNLAATPANLTMATLELGVRAIRDQRDFGNPQVRLDLEPQLLVVGTAQASVARALYTAQYDQTTGEVNSARVNVVQGMARPIVDSRVTGNRWFLLADPNRAPVVNIGLLNGVETPRVTEVGDGSVFKRTFEFSFAAGASLGDPEGVFRNNGG